MITTTLKHFLKIIHLEYYIFFSILLMIIGCGLFDKQSVKDVPVNLIIRNWGGPYEYIYFLNDEPIAGAKDASIVTWSGYPLKNGENKLQLIFNPLHGQLGQEINASIDIEIYNKGEASDHKHIDIPIKAESETEYTSLFFFKDKTQNYIVPEKLNPISLIKTKKEIEIISSDILHAFELRNKSSITNLLSLKDEKKVEQIFPNWFFDSKNNEITIVSVKKKDLDILIGQRMVLVKPNRKALQRKNIIGLFYAKINKQDIFFPISFFLFSKINDDWHSRGADGTFQKISMQNKGVGFPKKQTDQN